MVWKRVIVGVDDSPEAGAAAALGVWLAGALQGECFAIHAVDDLPLAFVEEEIMDRSAELRMALVAAARRRVTDALHASVPGCSTDRLVVRVGRPALVLEEVARELNADAVILGGKRHSTIGRWMSGSTVHHLVHRLRLPILIHARPSPDRALHRILVAVDASTTAPETAAVGRTLARALGADLRGLSVIEPPVPLPEVTPVLAQADYARRAHRLLAARVWPRLGQGAHTAIVEEGPVADAIRREAFRWEADLVVIGSHGKGLAERLLEGSVTERLVNDLPTSLLVLPPGGVARGDPRPVRGRSREPQAAGS